MYPKLSLLQMMELLHLLEKHKKFIFSTNTVALIANRKNDQDLLHDLSFYASSNMIEYVGEDIYTFKISSMIPFNAQELLVHALRPNVINYLSFEYMLNQYGIISQIPTILTVATTGRDGLYESASYRIEFTHIEHSYSTIINNSSYSEDQEILVASPKLALNDLISINRNTHLIQEDEIQEAQNFYENR